MLISLITISFNSFSQTDTSKVIIPNNVAKLIIKDLIKGDGCQLENQQLYVKIAKLEERESQKDSAIVILKEKDVNNQVIIGKKDEQIVLYKDLSTKLENEVKIEKTKTKIYKIAAGVASVTTALLATTLMIILR
jgi:hypothetical protein